MTKAKPTVDVVGGSGGGGGGASRSSRTSLAIRSGSCICCGLSETGIDTSLIAYESAAARTTVNTRDQR